MIEVNNKHKVPWQEGMTVSDLLERMGYTYHEIVVKVNGELVRKASYDSYTIPDGADVKAIHLIAGG
jgi:thiamine biosynthesis protein ThiS